MSTTPPVPPSDPVSSGPSPIPALGEEYGTAKKNLPPVVMVVGVVAVLAVILAVVAFIQRPQSPATGAIGDISVADVPSQGAVMLAINISIHNGGSSFLKMQAVKAELDTNGTVNSDEPASAVDFNRYVQALPELQAHVMPPLKIETIPAGGDAKGTILVLFPVSADAYAKRKSLKVTISAYGEVKPLVLEK